MKNKIKIEHAVKYKRNSIFADELHKFCDFAKLNDYIRVTDWDNGFGFDVEVSTTNNLGNRIFQLTYGEFEMLKKLVKLLNIEENGK